MPEKDLRQVLDYLVYAPIGIVSSVSESLPRAVENGKSLVESRTMVAKFVGKMAVDFAGAKVRSQVEDLRRHVVGTVATVLPGPWGDLAKFVFGQNDDDVSTKVTTPPTSKPPSSRTSERVFEAEVELSNNGSTHTTPKIDTKTYDDPNNEPIQPSSGPLATGPLGHSHSVTTHEIEKLIPRYATLSASQIVVLLDSLSIDQLNIVVSFERAKRGRKTILVKAEHLIQGYTKPIG